MKIEPRRIMDFIMGGCSGFCFFLGGLLGNGIGVLMLLTFIITTYRPRMLAQIDKDIAAELKEDEESDK